MTVTGDCLGEDNQHNFVVRVGTPLSFIIDHAGGVPQTASKAIAGGPMMGRPISNLDAPTVKGTGAILFLTREQTARRPQGNCIRCGRCASACPMGLEPFLLYRLGTHDMLDELEKNAVQDCIGCGCCLYSCPANIPLLDVINQAKAAVMGVMKARRAATKAAQTK